MSQHTSIVDLWGFPITVTYEYDEGEPAIFWPTERAHPGSPPNAALLSCLIGGVEVLEMLSARQIDRIEEACINAMEGYNEREVA